MHPLPSLIAYQGGTYERFAEDQIIWLLQAAAEEVSHEIQGTDQEVNEIDRKIQGLKEPFHPEHMSTKGSKILQLLLRRRMTRLAWLSLQSTSRNTSTDTDRPTFLGVSCWDINEDNSWDRSSYPPSWGIPHLDKTWWLIPHAPLQSLSFSWHRAWPLLHILQS